MRPFDFDFDFKFMIMIHPLKKDIRIESRGHRKSNEKIKSFSVVENFCKFIALSKVNAFGHF